ncbi:MAG TPA: SRPBCC family protein [Xanthomonadales bacterium]|nr:SRPBCC family protein [Xanthomonadales bacterium]
MTRILEFLISIAIVVVLFLGIGLLLPSHARVERKVELGNPVSQVYDTLNNLKKFNVWQPWVAVDPRAKYTIEGPEFGVGSKVRWNSMFDKSLGQGSIEIVETEPEELVKMSLDNNWRGTNKTWTMFIEQSSQTNAVTVRWVVDVDYGWDIMGRYAGMYLNGRVGELMNEGLGRLASFMATIPNADYSQVDVTLVDVAPSDWAYVGASVPAAPVKWLEAEEKMRAALQEVATFISRNKLEALGPARRYTNVLGEETNDFSMGFPVAANTAAPAGNVRQGPFYAGRALTTEYRGPRVGLGKPRDMLKAYALTHGYQFDRDLVGSWEEWMPDAEDGSPELTKLYLPIQ